MRYFTPDLWLQMQSGADRDTFLAAYDAWERATAAYTEEVSRIIPTASAYQPLRRFALLESLHDAVLEETWYTKEDRLCLLIRPADPHDRLVLLAYTLIGEPSVTADAFPEAFRTRQATWMYDEFALVEGMERSSEEPVFTHTILLGNGCELTIPFRRFRVSRYHSFLPRLQSAIASA